MSLDETRRRVLASATDRVLHHGMGSGLEHVRLEDAVRDADVSRTAAYRCWPRRDDFVADVLAELCAEAIPVGGERSPRATELLRDAIARDPSRLRTPEGRRDALHDAVQTTAEDDIAADREQTRRWRTYLALALAVSTLPEGEQRDHVQAAVTDAEAQITARLAAGYPVILELFGFAPRRTYDELAAVGLAMVRGLVIGGYTGVDPAPAVRAAFAVLVDGGTEVADTSEWDDDRINAILGQLSAPDVFPGAGS